MNLHKAAETEFSSGCNDPKILYRRVIINSRGDTVDEDFASAVRFQLVGDPLFLRLLPEENLYTARQLLGCKFWQQLGRREKGWAGAYVASLAAGGKAPLVRVTPARKYPIRYCLNSLPEEEIQSVKALLMVNPRSKRRP